MNLVLNLLLNSFVSGFNVIIIIIQTSVRLVRCQKLQHVTGEGEEQEEAE